ncbi:PREDICTED: uncharacterized protein LOC109470864 [Branchiostoma belcheri]|uniref:ATP-dependent helicase Rep n=1 Tax=Branchiostoma belcheri TaxID=7741 RepID=A0A6P4YM81_BRABE|nr:PREDICTED: uncharacterized protein LOC109470864 [Branchiostoma belcheri]
MAAPNRREAPACRWSFTLNNYGDDDLARLRNIDPAAIKFMVVGAEVSPTTGTPHLQGYVNFSTKVRTTQVKGHLGDRCHVEKAVGNDHDNERYCSKDGNVVERMGHPIRQGQRNDLTAATNFLQENDGDLSALAQEMPETFVRHHRGLEAYVSYARLQPARDFLTRCFVFVGPPGCGKSRLVREYLPDDTTTYYKPEGGWFDGYMGQSDVVLNDFHGDIPRPTFLNMVDRYPLRVPIKGGFVNFAARRVWITTNIFPNHWYTNDHDPAAIFRRITLFQLWDDAAQCFNELEYSNLAPGHVLYGWHYDY